MAEKFETSLCLYLRAFFYFLFVKVMYRSKLTFYWNFSCLKKFYLFLLTCSVSNLIFQSTCIIFVPHYYFVYNHSASDADKLFSLLKPSRI